MFTEESPLEKKTEISPLDGKKIVITRSVEQAADSLRLLESEGAFVISLPAIAFKPIALDETRLNNLVNGYYDYIVFSSANGVRFFFEQLSGKFIAGIREHTKVIAIGEKTRAYCDRKWLNVVYSPVEYNAKALVQELEGVDWKSSKILIPGSLISRKELFEGFNRLGANVDTVPVYDTVMPPRESVLDKILQIKQTNVDCYTFMSPSGFINFLRLMEIQGNHNFFDGSSIAVIGTTTENTVIDAGYQVHIKAKRATMESLVSSIKEYYLTEQLN
jgi:uroporphyrinogen III methyltransferase/synthase